MEFFGNFVILDLFNTLLGPIYIIQIIHIFLTSYDYLRVRDIMT